MMSWRTALSRRIPPNTPRSASRFWGGKCSPPAPAHLSAEPALPAPPLPLPNSESDVLDMLPISPQHRLGARWRPLRIHPVHAAEPPDRRFFRATARSNSGQRLYSTASRVSRAAIPEDPASSRRRERVTMTGEMRNLPPSLPEPRSSRIRLPGTRVRMTRGIASDGENKESATNRGRLERGDSVVQPAASSECVGTTHSLTSVSISWARWILML